MKTGLDRYRSESGTQTPDLKPQLELDHHNGLIAGQQLSPGWTRRLIQKWMPPPPRCRAWVSWIQMAHLLHHQEQPTLALKTENQAGTIRLGNTFRVLSEAYLQPPNQGIIINTIMNESLNITQQINDKITF